MALDRKTIKCYARKGKHRHVGLARKGFVTSDLSPSESFNDSSKTKLVHKRKRNKCERESFKENSVARGTYVSKPIGLKKASVRILRIENKATFSSIFNDSLPFEESPFSKLAKSVRKDLSLKFVNLNNFHSPSSFTGAKLQSSSSGCLTHTGSSGQVLSIDSEPLPPANSSQRSPCVTVAQETSPVPTNTVATKHFSENVPTPISTVSSEKSFPSISTEQGGNYVDRLSIDIIDGTPLPPSPVHRQWNKTFKRRRQAFLLTSTPLCKTSSLTSSQNHSSPFQSEEHKVESEILRSISVVSGSLSESILSTSWDAVLHACNQIQTVDFSAFVEQRTPMTLQKIGEGVFSEVFGCLDEGGNRSVWKVQPFDGDLIVNGEEQKKVRDILSEIYITSSLSDLRTGINFMTDCFVESLGFRCVHGPYPKVLLDLWQQYNKEKGSENDCPSVFSEQQLMLVTELEYAGVCMEDFQFSSAPQALSVFTQVAHALAVGEMAVEFEHRDLHWGNVMVCKTPAKHVSYVVAGEKRTLETRGVAAKIVDFSLSRASINGRSIFADLALNPDIFESTGEYQFEVYRLMRRHTEDIWSKFTPYTNVLWLHYLVLQMCKAVKYRNKKSKIHKQDMKKLISISSCILDYSSASDFVALQTFYPYTSNLLTS